MFLVICQTFPCQTFLLYSIIVHMMASTLIFITVYTTELLLQIIIISYASTYVI